jgi:hypothetical protein
MNVGEYLMFVVLTCPLFFYGVIAMGSYGLVVTGNGDLETQRMLLC